MIGSWVREESKLWKCENVALREVSTGERDGNDEIGGGVSKQLPCFRNMGCNRIIEESKLRKCVSLVLGALAFGSRSGKRWDEEEEEEEEGRSKGIYLVRSLMGN